MGRKAFVIKKVLIAGVVFAVIGLIAGCAPQQETGSSAAGASGAESGAASQVAWSAATDCGTCHVDAQATMEKDAMGACVHTKQAQTTCVTCHTDEAALASAHKKATATDKMPKKLKTTSVDVATCQNAGCHDLSKDEMLALTAGNTDLIDSKGTQVNPHDVIGKTEGHADITCANCHNMHKEPVSAAETCVTCHHSGVYECGTCH